MIRRNCSNKDCRLISDQNSNKYAMIRKKFWRCTAKPVDSKKKRKVAGYARVSPDHEDQQTSYEAQVDYYTNYIKGRDDWEFAGLYSDEEISATNTKHRDGFNQMIADALAGKIDLIITKSVSRFARNTVDSLSTIRKLKEHNIECYFEKENKCRTAPSASLMAAFVVAWSSSPRSAGTRTSRSPSGTARRYRHNRIKELTHLASAGCFCRAVVELFIILC